MEATARVVVDGALFSGEGKLLLLRRREGAWELPGGPLDFGEEPETAAVRLFAELTGIDAVPDRPLGGWSELNSAEGAARIHTVHIGYTMTLSGAMLGVELDAEKYAAFAWIQQTELAGKIDAPAPRKACERAFGMLARTRKNK